MKRLVFIVLTTIANPASLISVNFPFPSINTETLGVDNNLSFEDFELSLCELGSYDDSGIEFSYDKHGNRISRRVILLKSSSASADSVEQVYPIIEDLTDKYRFIIYPNPTKGELRIEIQGGEFESGEINIYSLSGILLLSTRDISRSNYLDLIEFNSGAYVMRVMVDGFVSEWKLIKE